MSSFPVTSRGLRKLHKELKDLLYVKRPEVVAEIARARAYGDLSENAEYHAAKEKQNELERRIQELEMKISRAQVVDVSLLKGPRICFGAHVGLYEEDEQKEYTYQIVGTDEADIQKGLISIESLLARELIGKEKGDVVEIHTPQKDRVYVIRSVLYQPELADD